MGKAFKNFMKISAFLALTSCTRYTCPTYFDTFNHSSGAANDFFNYFKNAESQGFVSEESEDIYASSEGFFDSDVDLNGDKKIVAYTPQVDTFRTENGMLILPAGEEPKDDLLFKGKVRNKNGLASSKGFLGGLFSNPERKRAKNRPKVVKMKTKPEKRKDSESDSTDTAELLYPPPSSDQFYYDLEFGNKQAIDSIVTDSLNVTTEIDSLEAEFGEFGEIETEEEETYEVDKKGRLKKKKKRKKKKPKAKGSKKEKSKREKQKKEKKKKEDDESDGMARIKDE